mgnify:CR=1 FL=1
MAPTKTRPLLWLLPAFAAAVMAPMYTPNSAKRACVARLARARAAELSRA